MEQQESFKVRHRIAMAMTATVTTGPIPMDKVHQRLDLQLGRPIKQMTTGPIIPTTTDVALQDNPFTVLNNDSGHRRTWTDI